MYMISSILSFKENYNYDLVVVSKSLDIANSQSVLWERLVSLAPMPMWSRSAFSTSLTLQIPRLFWGLNFCRAFNLVTVNCDEHCVCKQITVDIINEFPKGLEAPNQMNTAKPLPPVDVNLKLRPDCKAHIMELFPDLFDGVGTIKDAVVKLDINQVNHTDHSAS